MIHEAAHVQSATADLSGALANQTAELARLHAAEAEAVALARAASRARRRADSDAREARKREVEALEMATKSLAEAREHAKRGVDGVAAVLIKEACIDETPVQGDLRRPHLEDDKLRSLRKDVDASLVQRSSMWSGPGNKVVGDVARLLARKFGVDDAKALKIEAAALKADALDAAAATVAEALKRAAASAAEQQPQELNDEEEEDTIPALEDDDAFNDRLQTALEGVEDEAPSLAEAAKALGGLVVEADRLKDLRKLLSDALLRNPDGTERFDAARRDAVESLQAVESRIATVEDVRDELASTTIDWPIESLVVARNENEKLAKKARAMAGWMAAVGGGGSDAFRVYEGARAARAENDPFPLQEDDANALHKGRRTTVDAPSPRRISRRISRPDRRYRRRALEDDRRAGRLARGHDAIGRHAQRRRRPVAVVAGGRVRIAGVRDF